MPRRKITIEEATQVLQDSGYHVYQRPVEPVSIAEQPDTSVKKVNGSMVKVTLYAKHSVGSGGFLAEGADGKQITEAGVLTYGPGICIVPARLAQHLLHQDGLARQADENMLSKEQKSYIIVRKSTADGQRVNVGVQVSNDVLNGGLGMLPADMMYNIS